mmetsp:Transcript_19352/g.32830  ORF Transcript_19352/g.32830 Transcript_19352/m.32830 type:complete len:155 (+) Transcript_19352:81-545(+)
MDMSAIFMLVILITVSTVDALSVGVSGHRGYSYRYFPVSSRHSVKTFLSMDARDDIRKPIVEIEYCTGCKWLARSAWYAQELLTTFEKDLGKVVLVPNLEEGGDFRVRVDDKLVWDRKDKATPGFPEAKLMKQVIRDAIAPQMDLRHSEDKNMC